MKSLLLVLTLSVTAYAFVINVPKSSTAGKGIGKFELILRQKQVLSLFNNVCEKSTDSFIVRQASEFTADFCEGSYKDPEVLVRFKTYVQKGFLPENEIFSELNKEHYNEFVIIRDMLINAKDFDTFFTVAAWVRQNLNCGLYVNVLYSAIIYRADTNKLYIPPPYEILPNYFFKKDAIIAGAYLLSGEDIAFENVRNDGNSYIVNVNYTTDTEDDVSGNSLAYFNEDIGINTFVFLKKLMFENLWQTNSTDKLEVAEQIYYFMKQLSTRYELERYSNNVYDGMDLDWTKPITDNYESLLMYSNGKDFSGRTGEIDVSNVEYIEFLKKIENSVTSIVSQMVQNNISKREILKTLVETLMTGENSYATIAFKNIGKTLDVTDGTPSSLEHYMTMARDPMFWKINNKIVTIIENALSILPTYTRNELYFPGVQVNSADIKKVMTSFENFVTDTTDALKPLSSNVTFQFKVEQPRLNHKPFSIKLNISSVVSQKGVIKVFLAPKLMPGELAKNQRQFMLLDSFQITFKKGPNSITRSSTEMNSLSDDFWGLRTLEKYVEDAQFGLDTLSFESNKRFTGFPSRLSIPKGSEDGLPFQLFVFVAPLTKVIMLDSFSKRIEYNSAALSPGYPLDLFVDDDMLFDLPNALVKEIIITHKKTGKSGDFKKPYNKPTSSKKDEEFKDYETKKPILKSSGFAGKTESSKKSKWPINEKTKSDIKKTPINISNDENVDIDPIYFKDELPKTISFSDKTVENSKIINKPFDNIEITKKDYKDNKVKKDFVYDGKINKNIKVDDTENSFNMKAEIVPKFIINNDKSSKTVGTNKVINKTFDDMNKTIKETKNVVFDIKDDGSKKITIGDIDVNNKVNPAVEITVGQDKSFVKTINDKNDVQKTFNSVEKNSDASSPNLLKLSATKDFIKSGDVSDVHKKIVIDDHGLTDKNTDISIANDDGTNVEIHRIWDGPVLEVTAVDDKQPTVYEYLLKTTAKNGINFDDYEVYE